MSPGAKQVISGCTSVKFLLPGTLSVIFSLSVGLCQDAPRNNVVPPKYDLQAETKINGIVEEVKLFDLGTRKDFVELIVKSSDGNAVAYVCPKPFEDELGITFSKGDAITLTGAKVKREESDVILTRELVRGQETFMFRDNKGNPVWNWRTGK
jgi:hypothetical protein